MVDGRALLVALTPRVPVRPGGPGAGDHALPLSGRPRVARDAADRLRRDGAGYILVDRASTCGTIVEGQTVGGDTRGGTCSLHDGDVIIVGTSRSPYAFKFRVG